LNGRQPTLLHAPQIAGSPTPAHGHGGRCDSGHAVGVIKIRAARIGDAPTLQEIERLAGEQYRSVGLDAVADDEPASVQELTAYAEQGRSWVAVDGEGEVVGYVLVAEVDGAAHVDQVSVRPDRQGQGVGRALLDQVRAWATDTALPAISLTTFAEVPWNQPVYEHLGFEVISDSEIGPELRGIVRAESAQSWGTAARVTMRLLLEPDADDGP